MPNVWLIGDFDHSEAAPLAAEAIRIFQGAVFYRFDRPATAAASRADPPDLVIAVQHRPREFGSVEVDRLVGGHPLARFVAVLGPWCASSGRSEGLWPEAVTVHGRNFKSRLFFERDVLKGMTTPLSVTACRDEILLQQARCRISSLAPHQVLIHSPDRELADFWADAIVGAGATAIVAGRSKTEERSLTPSTVIWDLDPIGRSTLKGLVSCRRRHADAHLFGLAALPTASLIERARRSGANCVIAKPSSLEDLLAAIANNAG